MNARRLHIDMSSDFSVTVWVFQAGELFKVYYNVTRSSLIRAQRMQLKLFGQAKGQSPDETNQEVA